MAFCFQQNFLRTLKVKAERQHVRFPGILDIERIRQATTIGDYDELVVATVYSYADKFDYYAKNGSKFFLENIRVPTVAINALDDPFMDNTTLPTPEDVKNGSVRLIYHTYGGHCGFDGVDDASECGWIADEMARAIRHIATKTKEIVFT
jgi:hypothetical protein